VFTARRRSIIVLCAIATAAVSAAACVRQEGHVATAMRVGVGAPSKGTPGSGVDYVVTSLMTEPWLTSRPDGRQSERLVTTWSWDDSYTKLTLTLRPDVFFHDGTPLTSELAAAILRASITNREALSFASIAAVRVSGEHRIELELTQPNAFLLPDLSLATVRLPNKDAVGAGPFQVVKRDATGATLSAFPRYYRGRPALETVEVVNYPTQRNAWTALMRGEIDMLHEVSRDAAEFVERATEVNTYRFPRPYYIPLVFNVRHPVLKRAEVRQAINQALDREELVQEGLNGRGRPGDGPIWPEHWARSTALRPISFDPAGVKVRLDGLGLQTKPSTDGSLPGRFSFTCLVFADDARFERLAILVQRQLADVGIDMRLLPVKQPDLVLRLQAGDFDAVLFEMYGRSLSWLDMFWHSHDKGLINSGYRSADAVLDRMRTGRSDAEVKAAVAQFEQILRDDPPAAFMAWQETSRAVSSKIDVSPEKDRDILTNLWQWRPAALQTQGDR